MARPGSFWPPCGRSREWRRPRSPRSRVRIGQASRSTPRTLATYKSASANQPAPRPATRLLTTPGGRTPTWTGGRDITLTPRVGCLAGALSRSHTPPERACAPSSAGRSFAFFGVCRLGLAVIPWVPRSCGVEVLADVSPRRRLTIGRYTIRECPVPTRKSVRASTRGRVAVRLLG
jgi:hypothetical protein